MVRVRKLVFQIEGKHRIHAGGEVEKRPPWVPGLVPLSPSWREVAARACNVLKQITQRKRRAKTPKLRFGSDMHPIQKNTPA